MESLDILGRNCERHCLRVKTREEVLYKLSGLGGKTDKV